MKSANLRLFSIVTLTLLLTACGSFTINVGNGVVGSGNLKTETRSVSGFSAVTVSGQGSLNVSVTGTESLTIEAEDNILPLLTSDVSGNRLTLGIKPNTSIQPTKGIRYTLTIKDLNDVQISGNANSTVTGMNASTFSGAISGSGSLALTGKVDILTVQVSGSGSFNGEGLDSKSAAVTIPGSGSVIVKVSDKLDANISGSGWVTYIGDPTIHKTVTGSGSIARR